MKKKQKKQRRPARKKDNTLLLLGAAAIAAIFLFRGDDTGDGTTIPPILPGTVTPNSTQDKRDKIIIRPGISAGRQYSREQYNPFHYLPGDLGRQLPAIYAL